MMMKNDIIIPMSPYFLKIKSVDCVQINDPFENPTIATSNNNVIAKNDFDTLDLTNSTLAQ